MEGVKLYIDDYVKQLRVREYAYYGTFILFLVYLYINLIIHCKIIRHITQLRDFITKKHPKADGSKKLYKDLHQLLETEKKEKDKLAKSKKKGIKKS